MLAYLFRKIKDLIKGFPCVHKYKEILVFYESGSGLTFYFIISHILRFIAGVFFFLYDP